MKDHIPIDQLLEFILGARDKAYYAETDWIDRQDWLNGRELYEYFIRHDPSMRYWFGQILPKGELTPDGDIREKILYVIWRRKDWDTSFQRDADAKAGMEERIRRSDLKKEQIARLASALHKSLGLEPEMAMITAAGFYNKRLKEAAEQLGCKDIIWDL